MSDYKTAYAAVFDGLATALSGVTGLTVVKGGPMRLGVNLPQAILNPMPSPMANAYNEEGVETLVNVEVIVVVRESAPEDWFSDIINLLGDILDEVLDDRSLGGAAVDTVPTLISPAEIHFQSKMYYGGVIRLQARMLYEP